MIQAIVNLHQNASTIQEIVGHNRSGTGYNVYPVYVPGNEVDEDRPFITALITGTTPSQGRCVSELDQVAVDVICYAAEYEIMDQLANESRLVLDGHKGEVAGVIIESIRFVNQLDSLDESTGYFARIMSYNVAVRRKINKPHAVG